MAKVAFLGLGVMGYPMAAHLKNKGGHEVTVYNRTKAKAEKWAAGRAPRHGVQPHRRESRPMGQAVRRQDRADAQGRRARPGLRHVLRRQ